ncbi:MAG: hypothetical protein K0U18_00695 [Betaproteobacteria bacterium]|nr:hypothetical protein [Betaproteobacteria bacterium]MCH9848404.1 hypothetical protein [Betaproteobacteria bacterium]
MARESLDQLRQTIAQYAARMMVEDGINDFSYAKKKAGRQLGVLEKSVLPSNAEIEAEVRSYHELYNADEQPHELKQLRKAALATMQLFERFNPFLTGSVLDGSAGKNAQTNIHLFADSAKDVEIFLLSQQIPFESDEKTYRVSDRPSKNKKEKPHKTVPVFTLETEYGLQKLSVFEFDDMRIATKRPSDGSNADRIDIAGLKGIISTDRIL